MIGSVVLIFFFFFKSSSYSGLWWGSHACLHKQNLSVASAAAFMLYRYAAGSSHSCLWQHCADSRCALPLTLLQHHSCHRQCQCRRVLADNHPWIYINYPLQLSLHSRSLHHQIVNDTIPHLCFLLVHGNILTPPKSLPDNLPLKHFLHIQPIKKTVFFVFLSLSAGYKRPTALYSTLPSLFFQMGSKTNWDNSSKLQALSSEQHWVTRRSCILSHALSLFFPI